jgi:hypothetical protein
MKTSIFADWIPIKTFKPLRNVLHETFCKRITVFAIAAIERLCVNVADKSSEYNFVIFAEI